MSDPAAITCARSVASAEALDLLRELVAVQREMLAVLRRQAVAAPLADRLIQAVHALLEGEAFTAAQLLALADSPLSTRIELRAVVEDIVRGELDQPGAGRMFGRFLARNSQHEAAGLRLVSLGKGRDGLIYRIELATKTRAGNAWADELLKGGR